MRMRLVGYDGVRPPVPTTEEIPPIEPPDSGVPDDFVPPEPLILVLNDGDTFHKADYLAMGYNRFDVLCIGAAGGRGGSQDVLSTPGSIASWLTRYRAVPYGEEHIQGPGELYYTPGAVPLDYATSTPRYGAGGGGGGIHRVRGRLVLLPSSVPVEVGSAGADEVYPNPGGDGGASSFGDTICRASGGKGGKQYGVGGDFGGGGGQGGIGNAITAGGGAAATADGSWDGVIGKGGGGASFGLGNALYMKGGKGAYSSTDPTTSGPGGAAADQTFADTAPYVDHTDVHYGSPNAAVAPSYWTDYYAISSVFRTLAAIPGAGGGAKPFAINGSSQQYGSKAPGAIADGLVIIRLTYVIV